MYPDGPAAYVPFGPLKTIAFGNGTTQTWTFDARYRPLTDQFTSAGGTLASYSYGHDAGGNITAIQDVQNPAFSRTFGYDDLNRLVLADTGGGLWGTGGFVYDAMGNMLSQTLGGNVITFAYQGSTPLLTSTSTPGQSPAEVFYDAAGNEEVASRYTRTFSARNLLSERAGSLSTQMNLYDGRGIRLMSATQSGRRGTPATVSYHQYSPELNLLSRSTESETIRQMDIVWFAGRPVAQFDTDDESSTLRYTATDHLGTPFLQTDDAAQTVWRAEYTVRRRSHSSMACSGRFRAMSAMTSQTQTTTRNTIPTFKPRDRVSAPIARLCGSAWITSRSNLKARRTNGVGSGTTVKAQSVMLFRRVVFREIRRRLQALASRATNPVMRSRNA